MVTETPLIWEKRIASLQETTQIAHLVAGQLKASDVLLLQGNLGAGKTTFARFVIQHLMIPEMVEVPSPTFPVIWPYETPNAEVWHVDLYRLDPEEVPELGLQDHWAEGITLIEWPERLPFLPPDPLWITLTQNPTTGLRTLSLKGSALWQDSLLPLLNATI
jgi:tRNA threonylcarbamoyladenosine biosynthesis protein TsaE